MRGATLTWQWATSVRLPKSDYALLRSLRSTGAQWIDTGVSVKSTTRIVADVKMLGAGKNGVSGMNLKEFGFGGAERFFVSVNTSDDCADGVRPLNARRLVDLSVGGKAKVGGALADWSLQGDDLAACGTFCLFAARNQLAGAATDFADERLYGCRIFQDGRLLRHFVPVRRLSDGKPGLYDAMNDKFYANMGAGADFKAERAGLAILVQ